MLFRSKAETIPLTVSLEQARREIESSFQSEQFRVPMAAGPSRVNRLLHADSGMLNPATNSEQNAREEDQDAISLTVRLTDNGQSQADLPQSWDT
ncbi:hypothetical protein R1flu_007819 [Riccia fluitans]|uniref:R3H domain-containing protein n=1 Tax=Riccia fluitans TaxID=41844 RepID=A0ABD1Z0U5_9MARC